jgi:prepilin-type N-terminal cleavage/methylation domain-containing protein
VGILLYTWRNAVKNIRGFVLLELMVTIALLGILLGLMLPRLSSSTITKKDVEITTKNIVTKLRETRQLALSTGSTHYLDINTSSNDFAVYVNSVDIANIVGEKQKYNSSLILSGDIVFAFTSNGSIQTGYGTSLNIAFDTSEWSITVIPATGRIKWEKISD